MSMNPSQHPVRPALIVAVAIASSFAIGGVGGADVAGLGLNCAAAGCMG